MNSKPEKNHKDSPLYFVGIGASAGGLEAIGEFFKKMPTDSNLAFVVIQHLSPDYKSLMVELLNKHTSMEIYRVEEGMTVKRNCIYLITPKVNLTIFHGKFLLHPQERNGGINLPIDMFFASLAEDQGEKSIGIILSGTGSDGTRGIRAIKEKGGMIMSQREETAKFDGMPRSAVNSGMVDFIADTHELPEILMSYIKHPYAIKPDNHKGIISNQDGVNRIFSKLREKHKVDFTHYKQNTIVRRIERRMTITQVTSLQEYVRLIESSSVETLKLFQDLLIGVTNFFRDEQVFQDLEDNYIPNLIKEGKHPIRVWVPGCSTGEEAYTLAMIFNECLEKHKINRSVKVFATDVDKNAILHAGVGIYPSSIAADLPEKYLTKYFIKKEEYLQISRQIREMVIFAQHNLIKDPPFTNIDLLSCRNLLIYLQSVLQKRIFHYFNFSIRRAGILVLGNSESIGDAGEMFETVEHKLKIYKSKGKSRIAGMPADTIKMAGIDRTRSLLETTQFKGKVSLSIEEDRIIERFLTLISDDYGPLSLIVNEKFEMVYVLNDTYSLLKYPMGKSSHDVTKVLPSELSIPLATGLQRLFTNQQEIHYTNIHLRMGEGAKIFEMNLKVLPQKKGQPLLAAIFFTQKSSGNEQSESEGETYSLSDEAEQRISDLERELQFNKENLQATVEELETSNEELQATNEELLASNEELQSTNEELQSVNEELYTVNAEHQQKIIELTEVNMDLDNLIANAKIGIVFLDDELNIRRFTPQISKVYKIIESDVGRPISQFNHALENENLMDYIKTVLETQKIVEKRVVTRRGEDLLMTVIPYHVTKNICSGVIITFMSILTK